MSRQRWLFLSQLNCFSSCLADSYISTLLIGLSHNYVRFAPGTARIIPSLMATGQLWAWPSRFEPILEFFKESSYWKMVVSLTNLSVNWKSRTTEAKIPVNTVSMIAQDYVFRKQPFVLPTNGLNKNQRDRSHNTTKSKSIIISSWSLKLNYNDITMKKETRKNAHVISQKY